jgi:hypothetical protein
MNKPEQQIALSAVLAILGLKIQAANLQLEIFPESPYLQGQKDALVNVIQAFQKAVKPTV